MVFSYLITPIVTLYVGEERVKFFVHEGVLCKLKFFQSALKGHFREASEMSINMPEDNPEAIAALIQHLQTGVYGFTYSLIRTHQMQTSIRGTPGNQDGSLPEESPGTEVFAAAIFALQVYVVADKYEYPVLIPKAKANFQALISCDFLTDLEVLWIWKFAYAANLNLSILGMDSVSRKPNTVQRARSLLDNHPEEMRKTMSEFTDLACDLLSIVLR